MAAVKKPCLFCFLFVCLFVFVCLFLSFFVFVFCFVFYDILIFTYQYSKSGFLQMTLNFTLV